jgi:hypothetical protein
VHGLHHAFEDRIEQLARLLGIAVGEQFQFREVVRQAMLRQLAVRGEDRDLRHAFVEIDAYVYHSVASCLRVLWRAL